MTGENLVGVVDEVGGRNVEFVPEPLPHHSRPAVGRQPDADWTFWPTLADSLYMGMPLTRAMSLLGQHSAGLGKLARRLGAT